MKLSETARLYVLAAAYDGRDPDDEAAIRAWHDLVGDLPYADAVQAVRDHFTERRERLMPSDVITRVRVVQAARLAAVPDPDPRALGVDPDDPAACRQALRAHRERVARGDHPDLPLELEGPR